jgi:hypothetical protein
VFNRDKRVVNLCTFSLRRASRIIVYFCKSFVIPTPQLKQIVELLIIIIVSNINKQIIAFCRVQFGKLKVTILSLCHAYRFVFIKNSFLSHEEKIIITKGVKRYFLSTFLVIIIGFLGSAGFYHLLLTIIIVFIDRFTASYITFSHQLCVLYCFSFGLGWSNRVKLS